MPEYRPVRVTAHLAAPLASEPPQLDALLEWALAPFFLGERPAPEGVVPHNHLDRSSPAPEQGIIKIPLRRQWLGEWLVARCSAPILPKAPETVGHYAKRLAIEEALMLDPDERRTVQTTGGVYKSYRLPLRLRAVDRIVWLAVGCPRDLRKTLKKVLAVGKKTAHGHGRVLRWEVEPIAENLSWYAPHLQGQLLMRALPKGPWLPQNLVGWRPDYCSCCPPYWHPERLAECVTPV